LTRVPTKINVLNTNQGNVAYTVNSTLYKRLHLGTVEEVYPSISITHSHEGLWCCGQNSPTPVVKRVNIIPSSISLHPTPHLSRSHGGLGLQIRPNLVVFLSHYRKREIKKKAPCSSPSSPSTD
jgi:hypothetical protein